VDERDPIIEDRPGRQEVEKQLKRLQAGDLFVKAPLQTSLLRHVVEGSLKKQEITEKKLADAVFGGYALNSPKVRVNAKLLRERLSDYYNGPGRLDLVVITLPPGPAYRPVYSYSEHSACLIHYRRGLKHLYDPLRTALTIREAFNEFSMAIEADPNFARAYARKAESQLLEWILSDAFDVAVAFSGNETDSPEASLAKALDLDSDLVLAHIMRGVVHAVAGEWDDAEAHFNTALRLDPIEARQNWWYAAYLLTLGRRQEAFDIAKALVKQNLDSRNAMLI
jgi:tetratricopeptide (TPR) repeat protein